MSESVKILIEAENRASAVIDTTAKDIENKVKAIKTSGEQAKKSTEFFGVIANTLGGTELGSYASQLAGITEKTSQFAEVQKLGGAGALAFKAGLVGVVGVLGFQVGQGLGNVIFQTERWASELEKAKTESERLVEALQELKDFKFGRDSEEISLIRDPEERAAAVKAQRNVIDNEIKQRNDAIEKLKATKSGIDESIFSEDWADPKKIGQPSIAEIDKSIAAEEKLVEALNKKSLALIRNTDETAIRLKAMKEENALKDKSDAFLDGLKKELTLLEAIREEKTKTKLDGSKSSEVQVKAQQGGAFGADAQTEAEKLLSTIESIKTETAKRDKSDSFVAGLRDEVALLRAKKDEVFAIEAGQKTFGAEAGNEAAQLLKEKEMLIAKRDAEKKLEDDKIAKAKQIADLRQRELDRLEEERIALAQGKEAARAFALEKQGLSKDDAKRIAGEQTSIDKIKEAKAIDGKEKPTLQANESRLLTRGDGDDPTKQVAVNTANAFRELQLLNKRLLDTQLKTLNIKVVGGI